MALSSKGGRIHKGPPGTSQLLVVHSAQSCLAGCYYYGGPKRILRTSCVREAKWVEKLTRLIVVKKANKKVKPLRLSKVGEPCVYCGQPATVFDHVIPKRVAEFFDAGWNLVPACGLCNGAKSDDIKIELIRTPGKEPLEDAAVWAVVFNLLYAPFDAKKRLLERARQDIMRWGGLLGSMALGALEVYIGEHWCLLWKECQGKCATAGQLVELMNHDQVNFAVPDGLKHLLSG